MLNLEEGQIFDSQYELLRLIDTGGFTEVWEAKYLVAGNTVALKVYPKLDEEGIRNIEEEYKRLFELQHSNLLSVLHFGRFNGYPYLVMRYYPGGNASKKIGSSSEKEIAKCLLQIGGVLKYLHENNLVHQDIKPNNFLLDQFGNYFLADLGLSFKVRDTIRMSTATVSMNDVASMQTGLTPPPYRAPELYDRKRPNKDPLKATDIWALGASLYEMITGDPPFGDLGGIIQMNDPSVKDLPAEYSRDLDRLLKSCLEKDPAKRPVAADLVKKANHFVEFGAWTATKKEEKKRNSPVLIITITILMMVIGVFAIKKIIGSGATPVDPPIRFAKKKDSPVIKVRDSTHKATPDTAATFHFGNTTTEKTPEKTPGKRPEKKDNAVVIKNPKVRIPPHSSCAPVITSISRDKTSMKIAFHISSCSGSVSLYPPGSEHSFYVRSEGQTYELLSISKTGDEITVPSGGLSFTATFALPGSSATEIDIMEGKNRLDRGTSFFNFKGVSLK
jgi:serine/threonine protein kinase